MSKEHRLIQLSFWITLIILAMLVSPTSAHQQTITIVTNQQTVIINQYNGYGLNYNETALMEVQNRVEENTREVLSKPWINPLGCLIDFTTRFGNLERFMK